VSGTRSCIAADQTHGGLDHAHRVARLAVAQGAVTYSGPVLVDGSGVSVLP